MVKLEDAIDEFEKRKSELLTQIDDQVKSLLEEIKSCFDKQKMLEEKAIAFALGQIKTEAL